ncbi:bestrophin-like domain [Kribbella deserti]|uniref:DUF4239 domain-containing protein n=1 Tax=Kribbella deserti TaxID=1926257 RepID=A0ABV6QXX5_9ACTN
MSLYLSGTLWLIVVMIATAGLAVVSRKVRHKENREANNELAGQVFTIVGGVNVVIAAFVLISLFDAMDQARDNSYEEANALVGVKWASAALPEPARGKVDELTRSYAIEVKDREWAALREGRPVDTDGWDMLGEIQRTIDTAVTKNDRQEAGRSEAASRVWTVYQARQQRLNAASDGVSAVVWFAIMVGSVMSIALMFMFGGPKVFSYAIIVSMLAGSIGLLLFAIYQLQNPFSGGASVGPEAFVSALARLKQGG